MPTLLQLGIEIDPSASQTGKEAVIGQLREIGEAATSAANAGAEIGAGVAAGAEKASVGTTALERNTIALKNTIAAVRAELDGMARSETDLSINTGQVAEETNRFQRQLADLARWTAANPVKIVIDTSAYSASIEQAEAARIKFMDKAKAFSGSSLAIPPPGGGGGPPNEPPIHPVRPTFPFVPFPASGSPDIQPGNVQSNIVGGLPYPRITADLTDLAQAEEVAQAGSRRLSQSFTEISHVEAMGAFDRFSRSLRGTHQLLFAVAGLFGPLQTHVLSLASGVAAADIAFDRLNTRQDKTASGVVNQALANEELALKRVTEAANANGVAHEALQAKTLAGKAAAEAMAAAQKKLEVAELQQQLAATRVAQAKITDQGAIAGLAGFGSAADSAKAVNDAEKELAATEAYLTATRAESAAGAAAATAANAELSASLAAAAAAEQVAAAAQKDLALASKEVAVAQEAAAAASAGFLAAILPIIAVLAALAAAVTAIVFVYKTLKSAIEAGREWQTLSERLTTVTGSSRAAGEELKKLAAFRFGSNFALDELVEVDIKLHALGLAGAALMETLRQLGEVSAASGQKIGSIEAIFDSVARSGQVTTDQLTQLSQVGIDLFPQLEAASGKSGAAFMTALAAGNITFDQFKAALAAATTAGSTFAGAMERDSQTMDGVLRGISDRWTRWKQEFGQEIAPALAEALAVFDKWIGGVGGINATSLGQRVAAVIREATQAAKDGSFGTWLMGEFKRAVDYLKQMVSASDTWAGAETALKSAAASFIATLKNGLQNEVKGALFEIFSLNPERSLLGIPTKPNPYLPPASTGLRPANETSEEATKRLLGGTIMPLTTATNANTAAVQQNTKATEVDTSTTAAAGKILSAGGARNFGTTVGGAIDMTDEATFGAGSFSAHHGAWGEDLTNPNLRGVALSYQEAAALGGTADDAGVASFKNSLLTLTNAITGVATTVRVVDNGMSRPGQGPEATGPALRDIVAQPGTPTTLSTSLLTETERTEALAKAQTELNKVRLEGSKLAGLPSDSATIEQAANAMGLLNEQLQMGFIHQGEFNRRVDELKEKTASGLIDPAKVTGWESAFAGSLDKAADDARLATAAIERHFADMEIAIKNNTAGVGESFTFGVQKAADAWGTFDQQVSKIGENATNTLADGFSTALGDIATGAKTAGQAFRDFASSVASDISRMILKMLVLYAVQKLIGIVAPAAAPAQGPGLSGVPIGHTGMIVGGTPGGYHAPINAAAFEGALRFHGGGSVGGLMPDEQPVIAKKGEGIFTPEQMRALGGRGGGSTMNQTNTNSIEVHVHFDESGQASSETRRGNKGGTDNDADARALAQVVETAVVKHIANQTRFGGVLNPKS